MSDSLQPHGLGPARLLCPWDSLGKNTGVVDTSFSRDLPNPGIEPISPVSPALACRFLTTEPPGKPDEQACEDKYMNSYRCEDSLGAVHWRAGLELVARICNMSGKG